MAQRVEPAHKAGPSGNVRLLHTQLRGRAASRAHDGNERQTLLRAEVHLGRLEIEPLQRHFGVAGQHADFVVIARRIIEEGAGLGKHHEHLGRHMRKGSGRRRVKARQIAVRLMKDDALREHLHMASELVVVLTCLVQLAAAALDGFGRKRELSRRVHLDVRHLADSLPRGGNKRAYGVDLVAEELEADRTRGLGRPNVDKIAVHMKRARSIHCALRGIAKEQQFLGHCGKIDFLAYLKGNRHEVVAAHRRHAPQQRPRGGDRQAWLPRLQARKGTAARTHHGVVARFVRPGQIATQRDALDLVEPHVRGQCLRHALGRVLAGDNDHARARVARIERRDGKGPGRLGDSKRGILRRCKIALDISKLRRTGKLVGNPVNEHWGLLVSIAIPDGLRF